LDELSENAAYHRRVDNLTRYPDIEIQAHVLTLGAAIHIGTSDLYVRILEFVEENLRML